MRGIWLIAASVVMLAALTGCATTAAYETESADLAKANAEIQKAVAAPSQIAVADSASAKAVLIQRLVTKGPSALPVKCHDAATAWETAFIDAKTSEARDKTYGGYKDLPTCPSDMSQGA
eukprot:gene33166-55751_t